MARCEDFPCCGHDICPDYDDAGNQLNMKCVCGVTLPLNNRYSLCNACLNADSDDFDDRYEPEPDFTDDEENQLNNLYHVEGDFESQ